MPAKHWTVCLVARSKGAEDGSLQPGQSQSLRQEAAMAGIPGELLDDYSTLLVETGTKASAVCDPWLFEAIGTTTLDSCRGGLLQAGLALLFSD